MKLQVKVCYVSYPVASWFAAVWVHRTHGRGWRLGGVRQFVCKPTRRQIRDVNRDARKAYRKGREAIRGLKITHCYVDEAGL